MLIKWGPNSSHFLLINSITKSRICSLKHELSNIVDSCQKSFFGFGQSYSINSTQHRQTLRCSQITWNKLNNTFDRIYNSQKWVRSGILDKTSSWRARFGFRQTTRNKFRSFYVINHVNFHVNFAKKICSLENSAKNLKTYNNNRLSNISNIWLSFWFLKES